MSHDCNSLKGGFIASKEKARGKEKSKRAKKTEKRRTGKEIRQKINIQYDKCIFIYNFNKRYNINNPTTLKDPIKRRETPLSWSYKRDSSV
jgi:hypothetical protein